MSFQRKQFTFFRSFWDCMERLTPGEKGEYLLALCDYALNGRKPENMSDSVYGMFQLVVPTLDSSRKKAINGSQKGNATQKQTESKPKANGKQTAKEKEGEKEKEEEIEKEIEKEIEIENECFYISPEDLSKEISEKTDPVFDLLDRIGVRHGFKVAEEVQEYTLRFGTEWVLDACNRAADKGATSWAYIRTILDNDTKGQARKTGPARNNQDFLQSGQITPAMQRAIDQQLAAAEDRPEEGQK